MAQVNVQSLFGDLQRLGQQREYDKALKVANKILQAQADDEKAFHCKVVCLIQIGKFEDALAAIRKTPTLSGSLNFEKGYCEYRLNRTNEAYRTLTSIANPDNRTKELLAQVQYRMEDFEQCYNVFRDLLKNTTDDFQTERETNLSAVIASLQTWGDGNIDEFGLNEDAYEICYNHGCYLLGRGLYKEAFEKLKQAEVMCKKFFEEDPDATDEDVESELGVIRVQQGFALQKMNRREEAMALYNQVLKQRPSDTALVAVLSNNVVSLNKDQNVFDSKKKMKAATVGGLQQKLTSEQRETIAVNQCLLYMYSNQSDQCKKTAEALQKTYPNNDHPVLIHAAQLSKDKQYSQAVDLLKAHLSSSPAGNSLEVKLSLAQLYLSQNHLYQACDVLRTLGDLAYRPGVVSALVSLYTCQEDQSAAAEFLQEATAWHTESDPKSTDCLLMTRACANYHLRHGDPKVAAEMFERLCKRNPADNKATAQLIAAYSKFDPAKAQEISRKLPSPKELAADLDIEALENSLTSFSQKFKKQAKTDASPSSPASPKSGKSADQMLEKTKNKKKKKGKLPKNYDANAVVDQERWLPLKERSYYRGKKKRKGRSDVGKGTQGSVPASLMAELDASKPSSGAESPRGGAGTGSASGGATSSQSSQQGPRQQNPKGGKPKKKKGKGGKW